jgi:D-arginine dehydrogenase
MEEQPGHHTTGRSAAVFAEAYGNRVVRALTRASRAFLEAPPAGFSEQPLLSARGALFIASSEQLPALAALQHEVASTAGAMRSVSVEEAIARVPILRRDYVAGALLDDTAKDVDVHALHHGYLRCLRRAGGEIVTRARAVALHREGSGWRVETETGAFTSPRVVNAAGAWADEVGALAGAVRIGLSALRRTAFLVDAPRGMAISSWPLILDAEERFYFKPESGKLLASLADETPSVPCDARPEDLDIAIAIDRITRACDLRIDHVGRRWAGLRSFVADRTPVAGADPRAEGFFWLAGQGGYGIQTAPALARITSALVLGETIPADVAAQGVSVDDLSPARIAP